MDVGDGSAFAQYLVSPLTRPLPETPREAIARLAFEQSIVRQGRNLRADAVPSLTAAFIPFAAADAWRDECAAHVGRQARALVTSR